MEENPVVYVSNVSRNEFKRELITVVLRPLRERGKRAQEIITKATTTIVMLASLRK
jgi:hypothetical protein